jgi:tetratricopeptide (TPR) repeat protein
MRTLKIIAVASFVMVICFMLIGCGGGGPCSVSMRSGKVYFQKNKDYVKAEEWFRKALEQCGPNWEAHFWLAMAQAEQGKLADAGRSFKAAAEIAPPDKKPMVRDNQRHYFVDYYNAGVSANSVMNYKDAVAEFEKAIAVDPDDAKGYVNLAYAYSMIGEPEKALDALRSAVKADSNSVEGWRNLGISYQQKKDFDLAADALEHVLRLQPDDADALFTLGDIYFDKKEYQKALEKYTKAAEKKGDDPALQYQMGAVYFRIEKYQEAGLAFQKSAALTRDKDASLYYDAMFNLGVCYVKVQDFDAAITTFETLLVTRETAEIHEMLGAAYSKKGMKDRAMAEFEKAKEISGK